MRKPVFGVSEQVRHKPGCTATEVTAQLICGFVFAYAKSRFSHDAAHIMSYGINDIQVAPLFCP